MTMARGIIYVMKTVVPGLVKIGKTGPTNFEARMYQLEHNGYFNVAGLKRVFAIEVEDYDEKESMLDDIFSRSRVPNSELFALDVDLVVQLLSSFEGRQVYPKTETKEEAFKQATVDRSESAGLASVPDGRYHMEVVVERIGRTYTCDMDVVDGRFVIRKGTKVCPGLSAGASGLAREMRERFVDADGMVTSDVEFDYPSGAGSFVKGSYSNGWKEWISTDGRPLDVYRKGNN